MGEFVDHALQGDTEAAVALAHELLEDGFTVSCIITALLAEVQRIVGDRWERNDLTVADEHLVTAGTDSALHALAAAVTTTAADGHVLLACAEGDWHATPARMFAEQLRSAGWHVTFLGASTPAKDLAALLARRPVDAVVVTCSMSMHFMGVTRLVDAAHEHGTPVLVGGRALPGSTDRAIRLGADAGAADLADAVRVLTSWRQRPPTVRREPTVLPAQALDLEAHAHALAAAAFDTMRLRFPDLAGDDREHHREPGRDDVRALVQHLAAAHLVQDETVFTAFLDWLATVLEARGVPERWLVAGLETLLPHLSAPHPAAARLLRTGLERLARRAGSGAAGDPAVVEQDGPSVARPWAQALRSGDPVSAQQAIRQGRSPGLEGERQTRPDVARLVRSRRHAQAAEAARAGQRDLLLRQVVALLATGGASIGETLQAVAELATAAIGDGAVLQTFGEGGTTTTSLTTAHRTVAGQRMLTDWAQGVASATGAVEGGVTSTREVSRAHRGVIPEGDPAYPSWSWGNPYVVAPASFHGQVHGTLRLFRAAGRPDYDPADLDLLLVVAGRLGALLEAERAGARARQLTTELQQVNADQSKLLLELDGIEARERRHLAEAVHDDPLQLAVAAMLRLDLYRERLAASEPGVIDPGDLEQVDAIATPLAACVDHLRTHLGTLTPPDLSSGLARALRHLAEATFAGAPVRVETHGPDDLRLDLRTAETVYRILREALVNARKHAGATTVVLDVVEDDHTVTLRLVDDGVGLVDASPAAIAGTAVGHLGMASMRARAAAVNARFALADRVGGGTVVELRVPRHVEMACPVTWAR